MQRLIILPLVAWLEDSCLFQDKLLPPPGCFLVGFFWGWVGFGMGWVGFGGRYIPIIFLPKHLTQTRTYYCHVFSFLRKNITMRDANPSEVMEV